MIERFKVGRNLPWSQDFVESRLKQTLGLCRGHVNGVTGVKEKGKLVLRPLSSRPKLGDLDMFSRGHDRVNRSLPVLSQLVIVEGIS